MQPNVTLVTHFMGAPPSVPPEFGPVPVVPGYEILGELGRGGMGVVYKARQLGLNRVVALKTIAGDRRDDRLRFLAEVEAVAAIRHPNVVAVHEFGVAPGHPGAPSGHPFLAMEYVAGGSLAARLGAGPLPVREAAELVEQVARGVQAAHDVGIVHRDLKPGNILLSAEHGARNAGSETEHPGPSGSDPARRTPRPGVVPKVTDFGLAKRGGGPDLTQTGVALGTPTYMSPEQARGESRFIGPATDVHALGVILFECLAGRPPYTGDTTDTVMFLVMRADPPSLRAARPEVPRDLELICRKCLAKAPDERYPSAAALADDLGRFLAGAPVAVRAPGAVERVVKWARRHPLWATVYALVALVAGLSVLASGAGVLWWRAEDARSRAVAAREEADAQRGRAEGAGRDATAARDALNHLSAARAVDLAFREYEADNPGRARWLLESECPERFRGWEWRYVNRLVGRQYRVLRGAGPVSALARGGRWIGAAGGDGPLRVLDTADGTVREVPVAAAWVAEGPDGKLIAGTANGQIVTIDPGTGRELSRAPGDGVPHRFSPDGRFAVAVPHPADGVRREAVLRDARTGADVRTLRWPAGSASVARFSPAGDRVAVAGVHPHIEIVQGKDGVVETYHGAVRVYDTGTGRELAANLRADTGDILALAWSHDGKRLVTGSTAGRARVWDAESARQLGDDLFCGWTVWDVEFSPDGARVVGGCEDRAARVWDATTGRQLDVLRGHSLPVRAVRFAPDGSVVTGSDDGSVRFWRVADAPPEFALRDAPDAPARVAVSADGRYVATADRSPAVVVRDTRTGRVVGSTASAAAVCRVGFADAATVTFVDATGAAHAWAWADGGPKPAAPGAKLAGVVAVGANRAVQTGPNGSATVRDRATGAAVCALDEHPAVPDVADASADGRFVVTGGRDGTARLWDANTGAELRAFPGHTTPHTCVALSPDGNRLATLGQEGWLKVWDTATGLEVLTVRGEASNASAVGWSADGARLVSASGVKVRVLDATQPAK